VLPFEGSLRAFRARLADHGDGRPGVQPHSSAAIRADQRPIWIEKPLALNPDLHPSLAPSLGATTEDADPVFWKLRADIRDGLNKRSGDHIALDADTAAHKAVMPAGAGLLLKLSKAAIGRLGDDAPERGLVPLKITEVSFYLSQTRLGQIVFELDCGIKEPVAALLAEILHCLSHGRYSETAAWKSGLGRVDAANQIGINETEGEAKFFATERLPLFNIARELICGADDSSCVVAAPRAFTYVLASTSAQLSDGDRREAAARLARRMTEDYTPQAALEGVEIASPFEKITHACSVEGGSALVTDCDSVDFLRDFVSNVGENAYLMLALLAHKEFCDLAALTQGSSIYVEHDDRKDEDLLADKVRKMVMMRERILNFRLAHRFSLASFSSNHNLVHNAWRRAMQSEQMLADIAGDVREAEAYLSQHQAEFAEAREEKYRQSMVKRSSWLQGLLGFLVGLEGMRAVVDVTIRLGHLQTPESLAAGQLAGALGTRLVEQAHLSNFQFWLEVSPFVFGVVIGFWRFLHIRKGGEESGH
jgi:hypothetical protein